MISSKRTSEIFNERADWHYIKTDEIMMTPIRPGCRVGVGGALTEADSNDTSNSTIYGHNTKCDNSIRPMAVDRYDGIYDDTTNDTTNNNMDDYTSLMTVMMNGLCGGLNDDQSMASVSDKPPAKSRLQLSLLEHKTISSLILSIIINSNFMLIKCNNRIQTRLLSALMFINRLSSKQYETLLKILCACANIKQTNSIPTSIRTQMMITLLDIPPRLQTLICNDQKEYTFWYIVYHIIKYFMTSDVCTRNRLMTRLLRTSLIPTCMQQTIPMLLQTLKNNTEFLMRHNLKTNRLYKTQDITHLLTFNLNMTPVTHRLMNINNTCNNIGRRLITALNNICSFINSIYNKTAFMDTIPPPEINLYISIIEDIMKDYATTLNTLTDIIKQNSEYVELNSELILVLYNKIYTTLQSLVLWLHNVIRCVRGYTKSDGKLKNISMMEYDDEPVDMKSDVSADAPVK